MSSKAKHAQRSHKTFINNTQVFRTFETTAYSKSIFKNSRKQDNPSLPLLLLSKFKTLLRRKTGK